MIESIIEYLLSFAELHMNCNGLIARINAVDDIRDMDSDNLEEVPCIHVTRDSSRLLGRDDVFLPTFK